MHLSSAVVPWNTKRTCLESVLASCASVSACTASEQHSVFVVESLVT